MLFLIIVHILYPYILLHGALIQSDYTHAFNTRNDSRPLVIFQPISVVTIFPVHIQWNNKQ